MINYFDQYSRLHHKPVTIENPVPSNNGWIYSAYFQKAGGKVDMVNLRTGAALCKTENGSFLRSPGKITPPISRDEILGLVSLGLAAKSESWNFSPYPIPKFSLLKLLSQLYELRPYVEYFEKDSLNYGHIFVPKHRNYFWQNNLDQLYRFAFSVPVQDRYFILKKWDKFKFYNPFHLFYAGIAQLDKLGQSSGIRYLKYGWVANKEAMLEEFPEDHPIRNI